MFFKLQHQNQKPKNSDKPLPYDDLQLENAEEIISFIKQAADSQITGPSFG